MDSLNFNEWVELKEFNEIGVQKAPRQGDIVINKPSALFSKVLTRRGNRRDYTPREDDTNLSAFRVGDVGETSATGKAIVGQRHARPVTKQFRTGKLLDASKLFNVKGRRVFIYDPHSRWGDMLNKAVGEPEQVIDQQPINIAPEIDDMAQFLGRTDDPSDLTDNPHIQQKSLDPAYQKAAVQQGHDQLSTVLQQAASKAIEPEVELAPEVEPALALAEPEVSMEPVDDIGFSDIGLAASYNPTISNHGMYWKSFYEYNQSYNKFPTF